MNPFDLDVTSLLIWGIVAHLVADWLLQNDWMANNKGLRRERIIKGKVKTRWWDRHPAAYVHASIHGLLLALVFGWVSVSLAIVHLIVDTRTPLIWWSNLIRQTQPSGDGYDVGLEVRFWSDQVIHIVTVAVAALIVGNIL